MLNAWPLSPKLLRFLIQALKLQIATLETFYKTNDPAEDEANDFGNDLQLFKLLRDDAQKRHDEGEFNSFIYECWDETDDGIAQTTLLPRGSAAEHQERGLMGRDAKLVYSILAATSEEASAIHYLRQGFGGYTPIGEAGKCPHCSEVFYPMGSGQCWKCGHKQ
jgi:hypothetical protein